MDNGEAIPVSSDDEVLMVTMNNVEVIPVSSDDEATLVAEAAAKKRARAKKLARKAAARKAAEAAKAGSREADRIVAVRGINKKKGPAQIFDKFCVFPSLVALNQSQVNCLNKVARKRPYIPVYVCPVQNAIFDNTKEKMSFSKNYTLANIRRHLKLPAKVTVFTRKGNCGKVQMIMSKGKRKGAQITTNWKKVVKATKMQIGNIVRFWFHRSRDGLKMAVQTVM